MQAKSTYDKYRKNNNSNKNQDLESKEAKRNKDFSC